MTTKMVIVFYIYLQGLLASEFAKKFPNVQFVKAGDTATITCNRTATTFSNWQWYKEKEDGGLQDVARSSCSTPSSDRFEPNCKENLLAMVIKKVERSDSGVYYCSEPGLDQTFIVANTLIVTDPKPEEPTLSILVSVAEQNADPETTVLLCIALNWSKNWSLLKWSIDGKEEIDGWVTLDPNGSLRNLIFLPTRNKEKEVICYIKNLHESRNIFANLSTETKERDGGAQSQCYIVLYVGLGFAVLLLVIHQIILAKRRGSFCKKRPKKHTHPERAVRFRPEDELVTYAPVKG